MHAQCLIFFFAGFDTVSNAMTLTFYELALNTDVQDKLRKEIDETWQNCNGKLYYEALIKMKYMDMVVSGKMSIIIINFTYRGTIVTICFCLHAVLNQGRSDVTQLMRF